MQFRKTPLEGAYLVELEKLCAGQQFTDPEEGRVARLALPIALRRMNLQRTG
jgi:hypothetical protein